MHHHDAMHYSPRASLCRSRLVPRWVVTVLGWVNHLRTEPDIHPGQFNLGHLSVCKQNDYPTKAGDQTGTLRFTLAVSVVSHFELVKRRSVSSMENNSACIRGVLAMVCYFFTLLHFIGRNEKSFTCISWQKTHRPSVRLSVCPFHHFHVNRLLEN